MGAIVALLVALRLAAAALGWSFSPFDHLPQDHGVRGFWLLVVAAVLAALVWLIVREGEQSLWLAGPDGGVALPGAALERLAERRAEADEEVVRAEAQVRVARNAVIAEVRVFGRPLGDAARLSEQTSDRVRAGLVEVTGLTDVRVRVRPHILAVRELARHLP